MWPVNVPFNSNPTLIEMFLNAPAPARPITIDSVNYTDVLLRRFVFLYYLVLILYKLRIPKFKIV